MFFEFWTGRRPGYRALLFIAIASWTKLEFCRQEWGPVTQLSLSKLRPNSSFLSRKKNLRKVTVSYSAPVLARKIATSSGATTRNKICINFLLTIAGIQPRENHKWMQGPLQAAHRCRWQLAWQQRGAEVRHWTLQGAEQKAKRTNNAEHRCCNRPLEVKQMTLTMTTPCPSHQSRPNLHSRLKTLDSQLSAVNLTDCLGKKQDPYTAYNKQQPRRPTSLTYCFPTYATLCFRFRCQRFWFCITVNC